MIVDKSSGEVHLSNGSIIMFETRGGQYATKAEVESNQRSAQVPEEPYHHEREQRQLGGHAPHAAWYEHCVVNRGSNLFSRI